MRIESCVGVLEVPKHVARCVEDFVRRVLSACNARGCCDCIYLPETVCGSRLSMRVLSTTLLHELNTSISLILASSRGDRPSFGYLVSRSPLELLMVSVLDRRLYKVVAEGCVAIKTVCGWVACCDAPKRLSRILGSELSEVGTHLLAEDPDAERRVLRLVESAKSVKELFMALANHPSIAIALGTMLLLYLPPQHVRVEVRSLEGCALAKSNPMKLSIEVDPSALSRGGDDEGIGKAFTEVVLHEYLHLALRANSCSGSGAWLLGKPIGMERVVVETVNSIMKVVPLTLVRAVGKKVRELVALNRDSDERRVPRTVYTDLTFAVLTKNMDLIEKLLI